MIDGSTFLPVETRQLLAQYWPQLSLQQRNQLQGIITDELRNDLLVAKELLGELQRAETGIKRDMRLHAEQQETESAILVNFDAL